jgi:hypothetical protein
MILVFALIVTMAWDAILIVILLLLVMIMDIVVTKVNVCADRATR